LRVGLMLAMLAYPGCGSTPEEPSPPAPPDLRVAAASDLQGVLPTLIDRFTAATGVKVTPIVGASGQLAQQIRQGAPFDIFLSANMTFVRDLVRDGLIESDTVRAYARGRLVLVVNRASGVTVEGLAALARPEIKRIAIANPDLAPYGRAARQALEKAGFWEGLKPKVVQAETVRQALQYVQTGNAEVGLVAHSVAGAPEVRPSDIDPALYEPILQGLGVVARSSRGDSARQFARFLLSGEGQKILASYGFDPPQDVRAASE
jgi:molybdate transport system substrate-binding protein